MTIWHEDALKALGLTARPAASPEQIQRTTHDHEEGKETPAVTIDDLVSSGHLHPVALPEGPAAAEWLVSTVGKLPHAVHLRRLDGAPLSASSTGVPAQAPRWDPDRAGLALAGAAEGVVAVWTGTGRGLLLRFEPSSGFNILALDDVLPQALDVAPPADLPDAAGILSGLTLAEPLAGLVTHDASRGGLGPALALGRILRMADPAHACGVKETLEAALAGQPSPLEQAALAWLASLSAVQQADLQELADAAVGVLAMALDQADAHPDPASEHWDDQVLDLVRGRDELEALARLLRLGELQADFDDTLLAFDRRLLTFLRSLPETVTTDEPWLALALATAPSAWWLSVVS